MISKNKKTTFFISCQVAQIRKGGMLVVCQKIVRLLRLVFMKVFAPIAVRVGWNWPAAYGFLARGNMKKLKDLKSRIDVKDSDISALEEQTISYFKKIVDREPSEKSQSDWLKASHSLRALYLGQGKLDNMYEVCQKDAEFRSMVAKAHQFDDLGIEFLHVVNRIAQILYRRLQTTSTLATIMITP